MKFAHPSEKLFSEHLDLFDILVYEPTSFPLKWGSGAIKNVYTRLLFTSLNIYIEITTMNQKFITKKEIDT